MIAYRGKWIALPNRTILNGGFVVCEGGVIQQVTRNKPDGEIVEHDGLIVPGLVNAHTHLEFSDIAKPLGKPGTEFVEWVGEVMGYRRSRDELKNEATIHSGLAESVAAGVCAIGEISTFDWKVNELNGLHVTDFRELIGFRLEQSNEIQRTAKRHLDRELSFPSQQFGLSPHAPYSINCESLENAVHLSHKTNVPLAMHLAETQAELELLANHSGSFFDLLNRLGLWTPQNFPKDSTPGRFLEILSRSARALVVHGNYLSKEEVEYLADHSGTLKLVYCPRTHDFFGHDRYPLDLVLDLGIELAIGTDSRASNPDLSIWNEMEFIARKYSHVCPFEILKMGTINGAKALGVDRELGSIEVGKKAKLHFMPLSPESDLAQALLEVK